jgi:hypothetical protein
MTKKTNVQTTDEPQLASTPEPKVRAGFTIAVLDNEEFVFQIHGDKVGVIELSGLSSVAKSIIDQQIADRFKVQSS